MESFNGDDRCDRLLNFLDSVGKRYRDCTRDNYRIYCPEQDTVLKSLKRYYNDFPAHHAAGNGIILFGPSGTGKDHLLVALAKAIVLRHGISARWQNGPELYRQFRDRIDEDWKTEVALIRDYARPTLLIISDPQPPSGNAVTDYQATLLSSIVDRRYRDCKPTWVSMNVKNGEEAEERLGAGVVDRLRHGATSEFCNWASYREGLK